MPGPVHNGELTICSADESDVGLILAFIEELAEYERLSHEVVASEADLRATLFGPRPFAEVLIARLGSRPVGFALFFHNYSTFLGKPGIYVEDLYVRPAWRGKGIGQALLSWVARLAVERKCGRLEWSVLDWNASAVGFYKRLGAAPVTGWTVHRLTGKALHRLARESRGTRGTLEH